MMIIILLISHLILITTLPADCQPAKNECSTSAAHCGLYKEINAPIGRLYNGSSAVAGQFPSVVKVKTTFVDESEQLCSGVLVEPKKVLTLGQCLLHPDLTTQVRMISITPGFYSGLRGERGLHVSYGDFCMAPGFNRQTLDNNFAIVLLKESVCVNEAISPACLVERNFVNETLHMTTTSLMGPLVEERRLAEISHAQVVKTPCHESTKKSGWMCYKSTGSCAFPDSLDRGGPIFANIYNHQYVVGLASHSERDCCPDTGVFNYALNLFDFREVINKLIADCKLPPKPKS